MTVAGDKRPKRRWVLWVLLGLIVVYLIFPYFAGRYRIGELDGPAIYPACFHGGMYSLGYEGTYKGEGVGKPRKPLKSWLYERPWFYGLPQRPKPKEERERIVQFFNRGEEPDSIFEQMKAWNREIESGE